MCRHRQHTGAAESVNNKFRLPRTVLPESYALRLAPDLDAATYSGEISIKVKVSEPVDEIVLNAITVEDAGTPKEERNMTVTEALVRRGNGTAFYATIVEEPETERIRIKVNGTIGTGDWTVKLRFNGILNDKLKGFYRSTYKDEAGADQVIATTQFESTDARRAFPCFDEPDMKATFQITLEVNEELAAISNGPALSTTSLGNGKKVVEFAPTMKMSTYIVAFVVGKLVATKPVVVDGVEVRTWCVPGKEHLTPFSLESAQFALRYFRKYFGVPYPEKKLDMIAIPDFAAGAMENVGCVTFREDLLVDPKTSPRSALDWVAEVVAHELAHMWFGDLVTMKWWNGLWLNEAFATFMAAKCVDAWKRDWGVWDKFGLSRATAMKTDGLGSTRPIEFTVNHPDDAHAMFDVLTYEKGCSVMRMLEMYVGEDVFQRGIAAYIQKHAYGNTETADLWAALETASGQPVGQIMHGWIFESGYPIVSVRNADVAGSITISQQEFKFLSEKVNKDRRWMVPVTIKAATADGAVTEIKHLLTEREETIYIGENIDWVIVNAGGNGFFRVVYSADLLAKLTDDLQSTFSVIERVNLLADSWAGVQAGLRTSLEWVELAKLFADERNPNVWSVLSTGLSTIRRMMPKGKRAHFEQLVRDLAKPQFERLGWLPTAGETTQDTELRGTLISMLGMTGKDAGVIKKAPELFAAWKADASTVPGDVLQPVVSIMAANGDASCYDEFYGLYKSAKNPDVVDVFLYSLATFRNIDLLRRTLDYSLKVEEFRTQDAPFVVARVLGNPIGGEEAWTFVKANWDAMVELYPVSGLVRLCGGVQSLNTPAQEADVRAWFASHPVKGGGKTIDQYLEMLHVNVLLRQRDEQSLLDTFAPEPAPAPATDGGDEASTEGGAAEIPSMLPEGHATGALKQPDPDGSAQA
jgi:puromycin-sensitive aminopeptidase